MGQVAGAQLNLTSPALNLLPVTVYQIDNIPNVFAQIGDTANATATPGAVQLTIDNVQNLLLDATGSPYGALDTIFTAAPPGEGGVIAIRSGPAGGMMSSIRLASARRTCRRLPASAPMGWARR